MLQICCYLADPILGSEAYKHYAAVLDYDEAQIEVFPRSTETFLAFVLEDGITEPSQDKLSTQSFVSSLS